jgi:GNAT superfamily N-acetyltransferase
VIFRAASASDLDRIVPFLIPGPVSGLSPEAFRAGIADRQYRPGHIWLAEEAGVIEAAAIWWARPEDRLPGALDGIFVADETSPPARKTALAASVLNAGHQAYFRAGLIRAPEYHLLLSSDWRDDELAREAVAWRHEAARQAGLTNSLERIRYEWTAAAGLPAAPHRLLFRPEPDDEVFISLFSRALAGTLDQTSYLLKDLVGETAQARADVDFYRDRMRGKRTWWRVAHTPDGEPAGFGVPSRNTSSPVVGYLGVLPEHRGHGYADEILAEITRILVSEAGAAEAGIQADTDLVNRPMAAAFDRAGYRTLGHRLVLSAPLRT